MSISDIITVISILATIGVPLFIWIWRKYFIRPELTVELLYTGGYSSPQGYSNKNIAVDGVIDMQTALQNFKLHWDINIIIRNNSEVTAYYPDIYFKHDQVKFSKLDDLNSQDSIAGTEQVKLKGEYQEYEECVGTRRTQILGLPPAFNNCQVLLRYRNFAKHYFYSLYNHNDRSTTFLYRKPKGFEQYNI